MQSSHSVICSAIHSFHSIPSEACFFNSNAYFNPHFPLDNSKTVSCGEGIAKFHTLPCPFFSASFTSLPSSASWASPFSSSSSMGTPENILEPEAQKYVYSVWAQPTEDVRDRMKKLMSGLRSEFGGPEFEPHITVVGAIRLTADDALKKFRSACESLKAYNATVDRVATGTFFYQCVYLLIHPTPEVVETSDHCISHFGYNRSSPYMPHLSLLYGDLTDEEKKRAQERANALDDVSGLSFQISRLALYKTDTEDKTLKSWEKITDCVLSPS
ncbi:cyclic phosphodiesterase-like isoform X1 [Neltuma alba]|uniref:cyclic phosphodiesterase-like isoform X1 n=1 Tax=Neltuma alba TaxID=207710 RepID=UPI0010A2CF69|nr:cyclic phosphodiesterase-like isoform X1 [Prosopis alba]